MITHSEGRLLTVGEVADELRVTPQTVYRRIETGELEALQLGTGPKAPLRIRAGELERFLVSTTHDRPEAA